MKLRFEPVILDSGQDDDARLVFRDNRLALIISRLSDPHDGLAGSWFVEAIFDGSLGEKRPDPFSTLADVERWMSGSAGKDATVASA